MVKEMMNNKFEWNNPSSSSSSSSNLKQNHVLVKLVVSVLLVGVAFRLLYTGSFDVLPFVEDTTTTAKVEAAEVPASNYDVEEDSLLATTDFSVEEQEEEKAPAPATASNADDEVQEEYPQDQISQKAATIEIPGKCNLFVGEWVPDQLGPLYSYESCHFITDDQNCMKNGRPDSGYLDWRWKPRGCEIPRFNAERFLEMMRDKSWGFIGDSIARNHVQSLLCILSKVEIADEIYHDEEYRSKRWHFPSYNFTLSVIWSPFLLKSEIFEDMYGVSTGEIQLHLDKLDKKWTREYESFNYVTISGGKWFLKTAVYHDNNTVLGCHYCSNSKLTEFGIDNAYRKAIKLVFNFISNSHHNAVVLFRTTTPDHFENGEWFSGGTCNRTVPYKKGEISLNYIDSAMRKIELEEFKNVATTSGSVRRAKLKLLDTTLLSTLRPNGHPGPYRQFNPEKNTTVQNDCLHWCLPGPIDSWNDLVMEMLMRD
ncbi:protein trichome birefringence-like 25 [Papaver somniferum]|nr:protein trichome birefringence-like 25 [Papaver somniferum]